MNINTLGAAMLSSGTGLIVAVDSKVTFWLAVAFLIVGPFLMALHPRRP